VTGSGGQANALALALTPNKFAEVESAEVERHKQEARSKKSAKKKEHRTSCAITQAKNGDIGSF
jgi:hypothetical protein